MEKRFVRKGVPEAAFVAMRAAGMRYDKEAKRGYFVGEIPAEFAQYDAMAPEETPVAHAPDDWWSTWSGITARGAELDLWEEAFDHPQAFRVAVVDCALHQGERIPAEAFPAWAADVRVRYAPLRGRRLRSPAELLVPDALKAQLEGIETADARSEITARFYADEMRELLNRPTVHPVEWARVLVAREAAGEVFPDYAVQLARQALASPESTIEAALPAGFRRMFER